MDTAYNRDVLCVEDTQMLYTWSTSVADMQQGSVSAAQYREAVSAPKMAVT